MTASAQKQDWSCDFAAVAAAMEHAGWSEVRVTRPFRARPAVAVWATGPDRKGRMRERFLEATGNPTPAQIVAAFAARFGAPPERHVAAPASAGEDLEDRRA